MTIYQYNSSNAKTDGGNVAALLLQMIKYSGIIIIVWGLFDFAMAMKNEQPEKKEPAIIKIVIGCFLFGISTFLKGAGIIA